MTLKFFTKKLNINSKIQNGVKSIISVFFIHVKRYVYRKIMKKKKLNILTAITNIF